MNKKSIIIISIIVLLVAIRIALPYIIKNYINKTLADMEGYTGWVEDVDLHLYRGAYAIDGLTIKKKTGNIPVPFLQIQTIDLSIEWRALLKGKLVSEVALQRPVLNFVDGPTEEQDQTGEENDWTKPLKEIAPFKVNRFEINNGAITFKNLHSEPKVDLGVRNLNALATNLSNAYKETNKLPSYVKLTGQTSGEGNVFMEGRMNVLKQVPDIDVKFSLEKLQLPSINEFPKAYANIDFEKGSVSVFSDLRVVDSSVNGFIKPLLYDVKVLDLKKEKDNTLLETVYEGAVGVTEDILKNKRKDQFATRVPLTGSLGDVNTNIWVTLGGILRNGFIKAYSENFNPEKKEKKDNKDKKDKDDDKKKDDKDKKDRKKDKK